MIVIGDGIRWMLSEMLRIVGFPVDPSTVREWIGVPEKISDRKFPDICTRLVESIAHFFPMDARHCLAELLIAFMARNRMDFERWLESGRVTIGFAYEGAEKIAAKNPGPAASYATVLGLGALLEGLYFERNPARKAQANREAVKYFERAEQLSLQTNVLTGYLHHRIRVWLAIAAYNAVDKEIHRDAALRQAVSQKLISLNALAETRVLQELLKADCAPLFHRAIFATVLRDFDQAAEAWLEIQKLNKDTASDYFKGRYESFLKEPLIELEMPQIKAKAAQLMAAQKPKHRATANAWTVRMG